METIFVRPAAGMLVRDPETHAPLPAEGLRVPRTGYWERRIRTGDVLVGEASEKPATKPKSKE